MRVTKLNIAVTRFAPFVSHLPLSPDEPDVLEYRNITRSSRFSKKPADKTYPSSELHQTE
jgi:hypothetical protein